MRKRKINGLIPLDLIHEYRSWGLDELQESQNVYQREANDMTRVFGELHFIPLALYQIIGNLQDELGEFSKSKTLRMRIKDQIKNTDGVSHPYYFNSVLNVAESHSRLGEWMEAQELLEAVLKHTESTHGRQSLVAMSIIHKLASTLCNRGQWKEARELEVQVMETFKRELGQKHP
jgi:tetratricopeptide (TPR) repeat protein